MQCKSCGTDAPAEAMFCQKCGANMQDDAAAEANPTNTPAERLRNATGNQNDDLEEEEDLWEGGYSGKAMIGSWVLAAVLTVVGIIAAIMIGGGYVWMAILAVIALIWLGAASSFGYRKLSVHYLLTNQRFIHKAGLLKRTTDRIEVIDIDDVTYEQGFVQRMMGVGTINISSSDRSHPELKLLGIDDVKRIADLIDDVRRKERRRRGLHIEAI